ncbi:D-tyrosyl-tRNA(Tyr) deacylase [Ceratobasidium sp. UAMH 11750]|nr:D-tyrosyl-tRNA(Tyr) deacylase [Ceratobasidium sp. UAMH 11750]
MQKIRDYDSMPLGLLRSSMWGHFTNFDSSTKLEQVDAGRTNPRGPLLPTSSIMRAVIQRVSSASVTVDSEVVSSISRGLMCLIGIGDDDTSKDSEYIANKILSLKIFDDPKAGSMWRQSVKDIEGEILCVSQFTLMAKTIKGAKPDFHKAMNGELSRPMYADFLDMLGKGYDPARIKDGQFGAMMSISLTNEGPVTLTIDSRKFEYTPVVETNSKKKPANADNVASQENK